MTYQELYEAQAVWNDVCEMVDELMGDQEVQIVIETSIDGMEYWLCNHFVKSHNDVPMLTYSNGEQHDCEFNDWQELKEKIFELVTSGKVTNYYIESV